MGEREIGEFLTYVAVKENAGASTQNQALSAPLLIYRKVLRKDLDLPIELVRAKRPEHGPEGGRQAAAAVKPNIERNASNATQT